MKLSEKIHTCRKKQGLSQEALAEQLGVSRQAVSKWETGEAEPEIGKLKLLAQAFGVTTDWLLSEEEPAPQTESEPQVTYRIPKRQPVDHFDRATGMIGKAARRWGWLAGIYVALPGVGMMLIGLIASSVSNSMVNSFEQMTGGLGLANGFGSGGYLEINGQMYPLDGNQLSVPNPVSTVGGIIAFIGFCILATGIALAVYLKKKGQEKDE